MRRTCFVLNYYLKLNVVVPIVFSVGQWCVCRGEGGGGEGGGRGVQLPSPSLAKYHVGRGASYPVQA